MRYWMENPIKANFGKRETNCGKRRYSEVSLADTLPYFLSEWSVFYVALAALLSIAVLLFLIWLACCCCLRK